MTKLINNIHDKTFKKVLSDPKLAQRFFKQHLPSNMQQDIDLTSLELKKGSFIDDNLAEHLTDLLYTVKIANQPGYLYLLLEHQSTSEPLMAFRLLKYMLNIMQQHMQKHKTKKLPLILPLVYYIGHRPASKFVPDIMDCFENPTLARQYFLKPFTLVDLQKMSDDELMQDKALAGLELLQKHVKDRDLSVLLDKMLTDGIFIEMRQQSGEYFHVMLKYIVNTGKLQNAEHFLESLSAQLPEEKNNMMTIAQQLKKQGFHSAQLEIAKKLLQSGDLNQERIIQLTGLSRSELSKIDFSY